MLSVFRAKGSNLGKKPLLAENPKCVKMSLVLIFDPINYYSSQIILLNNENILTIFKLGYNINSQWISFFCYFSTNIIST